MTLDVQPADSGHRVRAVLLVESGTSVEATASLRRRITEEFPDGVDLELVTMRADPVELPDDPVAATETAKPSAAPP